MAERLEDVFARRIREVAAERSWPISHVADRAGVAHSAFWAILNAKASTTLAMVQRIADALEVTPLALLADGDAARVAARPRPKAAPRRRPTPSRT